MSDRGVYRVNYCDTNGQPLSAFVCAESENEASAFLGVADGVAQTSRVAFPVEVVGVDAPHDPIPAPPITKAPPQPPRQFSDSEIARLRALLAKS